MKVILVAFAAISYYFVPTLTLGLLCVSVGSLALKVALHILTQQDKKIQETKARRIAIADSKRMEEFHDTLRHHFNPNATDESHYEKRLKNLVYSQNFEFNRLC
jgi:hypothetical protein